MTTAAVTAILLLLAATPTIEKQPQVAERRIAEQQIAARPVVAALPEISSLPLVTGPINTGPKTRTPQDHAVELGRHLFTRVWEPALAGPDSGDGLGPMFNGRSCAECHHQGGVGGGGSALHNVEFIQQLVPDTDSEWYLTRVSRESSRVHRGRPTDVVMLHRFGVRKEYAVWRADEIIALSRFDPEIKPKLGLSREYPEAHGPPRGEGSFVDHQHDASLAQPCVMKLSMMPNVEGIRFHVVPHPEPPTVGFICGGCRTPPYREGPRAWAINTPPLFGLGRLEQISLADVQAIAAAQPETIRGRAAILPDGRLGRFGWKAQHASLRDFNDEACAVELGLNTPTARQAAPPRLDLADEEEGASPYWRRVRSNPNISAHGVDAVTAFVRALPQPRELVDTRGLRAAQASDPAPTASPNTVVNDVLVGRRLLLSIGCAVCHTPEIGVVSGVYSDLLLHDIGTETWGSYFQRGFGEHTAAPGEFRTPPLWGVADSPPYLHNGRAQTLEQAIEAHGGQAEEAAKNFREELTPDQRRQLVAFLKNLRAPLP
jgi:CxxC motif-containing protein (DUF1111 family)